MTRATVPKSLVLVIGILGGSAPFAFYLGNSAMGALILVAFAGTVGLINANYLKQIIEINNLQKE